jgi:hypothetical protein
MSALLSAFDKATLALADPNVVINALSRFRSQACPPWLPAAHPYPDGALPTGSAAFAAVSGADMLEVIAVRGPLHAIDGWTYLGRAFSSLLSGQAHAARHLSYYAELRAALSILASSGIGVFNRRNAVVDAAGAVHIMSNHATHDMAWLALAEWSVSAASLERLIKPIQLAGASLLEPFREFFPAQASTAAGELMAEWGFDLQQGTTDRDQRNWSSYQPTALGPLITTPAQDSVFLKMFWNACRPNGVELERHLLRILIEREARAHGQEVYEYPHSHARLQESTKVVVPFDFLTRVDEPVDHDFLIRLSDRSLPSPPYAMMCRAGLLLKLATGMAEENLRAAGIQPVHHFNNWWQEFGANHGLWRPDRPPATTADLWDDIDLALEESAAAPTDHRYEWVSALAGNALRMCETERVALWGLFQ